MEESCLGGRCIISSGGIARDANGFFMGEGCDPLFIWTRPPPLRPIFADYSFVGVFVGIGFGILYWSKTGLKMSCGVNLLFDVCARF